MHEISIGCMWLSGSNMWQDIQYIGNNTHDDFPYKRRAIKGERRGRVKRHTDGSDFLVILFSVDAEGKKDKRPALPDPSRRI